MLGPKRVLLSRNGCMVTHQRNEAYTWGSHVYMCAILAGKGYEPHGRNHTIFTSAEVSLHPEADKGSMPKQGHLGWFRKRRQTCFGQFIVRGMACASQGPSLGHTETHKLHKLPTPERAKAPKSQKKRPKALQNQSVDAVSIGPAHTLQQQIEV